MRIVLDTNVVVSALLWRGTAYRLVEAIKAQPEAALFSRAALLEELADVLHRPQHSKQFALVGRSAAGLLVDYAEAVEVVVPQALPAPVSRDPEDDHVIACALAAQADIIVSGDRDLIEIKQRQGIEIVSTALAIERVAQGSR